MSPPTHTSIALYNGKYFDPWSPDPSVIDLDVIERGLSVPRFNNQTSRPIHTTEHAMRVRRFARELVRQPGFVEATRRTYIASVEQWAIHHDDHEALVPWGDCLSPGKTPEMKQVEIEVDAAVRLALGIPRPSAEAFAIVKTADAIALYFEAMLWGGPLASDWAPEIVDRICGEGRTVSEFGWSKSSVVERFMPLVEPRPGEDWRAQVEELLR